jgi:endonuclease G
MAKKAKTAKTAKKVKKAVAKARKTVRAKASQGEVKKPRDVLMEKLKRYVRAHAEGFLNDPNISSVGIGYKQTDGKEMPQLAIQFSVHSKVKPEDVSAEGSRLIPKTLNVDGTSVPTDVIERSYKPSFTTIELKPKDDRRVRADVVTPGMSVGSIATTAGTLGTFVRDSQTKQIVILSNWHVLQGAQGKVGDDVVQPGKFDDNRVEKNYVGKLLRSHLGPAGDCAIASMSGRGISNDIIGLGTSVARIGEPHLKDRVVKSGRTTAVTYGVVSRLEVNTKMVYPGGTSATIGGFEIVPDPKKAAADNEISRGGDSGSAWMALDKKGNTTDVMLGLHFAGDDDDGGPSEFALACYANSVMTKLEIEPVGKAERHVPAAQAVAEGVDEFRQGFDRNFLKFAVEPPKFSKVRRDDLAGLDGDNEIKYCHFSVWLSKQRRYPTCVAWNIDGSKFKRVKRVSFRTDRRGDLEEYQLTNDIYVSNVLDKGHIARRADLCWGTPTEAKQGNYDSFFYTNICPQHEAFNQSDDTSDDPEGGLWGRLENTVFDSEDPHELQISLMGGPVISKKDRKFTQNDEECYLPREFWKVVAYVDDTDNKKKVFGFLLTQANLIEGLTVAEGLDFDQWLWARITLQDLQEKTGVIFPKGLKDNEVGFVKPQALGATMSVKPLFSAADYFSS